MRNKKNNNFLAKLVLPFFVVAVVAGSFSVDWNRFGRAPVSYYGMGAIPMFATCKIDNAGVPQKKPTLAKSAVAGKKGKKSDKSAEKKATKTAVSSDVK